MANLYKFILTLSIAIILTACGSVKPPKQSSYKHSYPTRHVQPIHITHISHYLGSQELMLQSMGLIGVPYQYGGNNTNTGFDCSGMIQYIYKNALNVNLPRTARDMAAASRTISPSQLQPGDLVFFNTSKSNPYSHVGLYIGNGEFIHAPSSKGTIRTEKLNNPYFQQRFIGAHTFF